VSEREGEHSLDEAQERGWAALTDKISRERGFGCASYKEKCLRRRVAVRMRARGVHDYEDYARVLDGDSREWERLLDALTINVTKLFRNWETWAAMDAKMLPTLLAPGTAPVRVWSAGASSGREAYSLAVLLHRHLARAGRVAEFGRVEILGTDIDAGSLASAERATFEEGDFADTPDDLRAEYFAPDRPFGLRADVRGAVRFERRDLLEEPPPPGLFQLVVCRNVLIYFDRESQERLFAAFHEALAPGGYLVLGKVETLLGDARHRFLPVDPRERIFRRPGDAP
jgi:chemotaxis methyl-accepting protein methylase